ncbi:hypothetical protein [Paenibacillus silviterrae]|nr:hypothetical protein [Paenibacillus chinjuensis]
MLSPLQLEMEMLQNSREYEGRNKKSGTPSLQAPLVSWFTIAISTGLSIM